MTERTLRKRIRLRANHEGVGGCRQSTAKPGARGGGCLGCAARIPYPAATRLELLDASRLAQLDALDAVSGRRGGKTATTAAHVKGDG